MSANNANHGDSDVERWYSGYLVVRNISDDLARQIADVAKDTPIFEAYANAVEVEYRGRDTNRFVVRALIRLARMIENADGEVQCQVSGDGTEVRFEFYRIREGRLFRQLGEIVRQSEHEVTDPI